MTAYRLGDYYTIHISFITIYYIEKCLLGCVTIPLSDIPSTGLECWFKLEARSQRSSVQGRIRLKMWLSTREDRGVSEEDNWAEVRQHENLTCMFIDYELRNWSRETWTWQGDLPGQALTILHQHAVQGKTTFQIIDGLEVLRCMGCRWSFRSTKGFVAVCCCCQGLHVLSFGSAVDASATHWLRTCLACHEYEQGRRALAERTLYCYARYVLQTFLRS